MLRCKQEKLYYAIHAMSRAFQTFIFSLDRIDINYHESESELFEASAWPSG